MITDFSNRKNNFTFKDLLLVVILFLLLLLTVVKLCNFYFDVSKKSIQMDFTAYYTAGKTLNNGLNPYKNYIVENWNLWDGISIFKHSRFLYPPLVANFFQPFALMPYISAKYVWNALNFLFLFVSVCLLIYMFGFYKSITKILISLIISLNFFPFVALWERGQIDCLTLMLIVVSFLIINKNNKPEFIAGALLAITTIFKLYAVLLIPFLVIKKKYASVIGYLTGIILLLLLTVLLNGFDSSYNYLTSELPRIAEYGSSGAGSMRIPSRILSDYFPMTPTSISLVDSRMYLTEIISFNSKASLIRVFEVALEKTGIHISNPVLSIVVYLILFTGLFWMYKKNNNIFNAENNFIFWQIVLIVILLSGSYTWIMNLVWILPAGFILLELLPGLLKRKNIFLSLFLIVGFCLVAFPDNLLVTKKMGLLGELLKSRFIAGEIILFVSLVWYLKLNSSILKLNTEKIL